MATQLAGVTAANIMEVESASKAARVTPKPVDYGALGVYSIAQASGVMAAGLAGAAPIFSMRWSSANIMVLKKVILSAGNTATAFTAGICTFNLFFARSFTVNDTGGTDITPAAAMTKLRTSMGNSLFAANGVRISSTATLTAGTRTLDTNPIGSISVSIPATAGTTILSPADLFRAQAGDYPVVLAQNEGVVIQATVPATGTWTFSAQAQWEELTAYVP